MRPQTRGSRTHTRPRHLRLVSCVVVGLFAVLGGCQLVPGASPEPTATTSSVPATRYPTGEMCSLVPVSELASELSAQARVLAESSTASVCTYEVEGEGEPYHVAVRLEDGFESLDAVRSVFADGHQIENLGDSAYWSSDVSALWLEEAGSLYAIQLIGFPGTAEEAADVAVAVAELVSSQL